MMAIYLVDYENTQNLLGINDLSENDYVIIFYSQKASSLSFDVHKEILTSKATIEYKCVDVGSQNALDFQLVTYLGYLINQHEISECKFYIVSKDKGFSYVVAFWKQEKNIDIQIISDLTGKPQSIAVENVKTKTVKTVVKNTKANASVENVLKQANLGLNKNEIKEICVMVAKYKTTQAINSNLNKLLKDSTKTGEIFKLIKPFINKKTK
ncbi:MAG: hypothetical protein K2O28_03555 [Clostridia bacterium]|nr:hypothetical protein [Clostridia bacterium]